MSAKIQLLIPAGGMGTRLGQNLPKALVPIDERPIIVHTLETFQAMNLVDNAIIAAPEEHLSSFQSTLHEFFPALRFHVVPGGAERQDSVRLGLEALHSDTEIVAIHDAARPFPPVDAVLRAIQTASETGAATVALPCSDTILQSNTQGQLVDTPDRANLWACQTPQVFQKEIILAAHAEARKQGLAFTDDATLVNWHGAKVTLVPGSADNIKITTPEDLYFAHHLIKEAQS